MNERINGFLKGIKASKIDPKKGLVLLAAVVGIILIVISSFGSDKKHEAEESTKADSGFSEEEYGAKLETKIEEMVSSLYGAGRSKVIITLDCDYETVYARDGSYSKNDLSSDEESEYIIIDSDEREDGLVLKTVTPKVRGVAVLCEGGNNPVVVQSIIDMLSALLDIGTSNISVSKIQ